MRIPCMEFVGERFECGGGGRPGGKVQDRLFSCGSDFPEDLREWASESELAHLVEDAVKRVSHEAGGRTRAWEVLLGILGYFYSTGMYVSDEIENALYGNAN